MTGTETNPIQVPSVSPPEVNTQRPAPLMAASLPTQAPPSKTKGKGKGKGKKNNATAPSNNHYVLPGPEEALQAFMNGLEAFITEWNETPREISQAPFSHILPVPLTTPMDTPCPRDEIIKVVTDSQFAPIEDVAERDASRMHGFTVSERLAIYDEEEEGWGGLPKYTCK